jgi:tRNA uridine 5-carboxymethylaminomethyl modification enzyme
LLLQLQLQLQLLVVRRHPDPELAEGEGPASLAQSHNAGAPGPASGTRVSEPAPLPLKGDLFAQLLKRPATTLEQLLPALLPRMASNPLFAPWLSAIAAASRPSPLAPRLSPLASRISNLASRIPPLPAWVRNELKTVETAIKFAGYLAQQQRSMARLRADEARTIPRTFDYHSCSGLSREMVEKLDRIRPLTLGQASRIAGVTPAAVTLIQCFLEIQSRTAPARTAPARSA